MEYEYPVSIRIVRSPAYTLVITQRPVCRWQVEIVEGRIRITLVDRILQRIEIIITNIEIYIFVDIVVFRIIDLRIDQVAVPGPDGLIEIHHRR